MIEKILYDLQKAIHRETEEGCDIYYVEGKGALAVKRGMPLSVQYVIVAVDDAQIQGAVRRMTR